MSTAMALSTMEMYYSLFNQWGLFGCLIFPCCVPYIKSGPKWKFSGPLIVWLDHWWSHVFAPVLSYCSEMSPSEVVHNVVSSGAYCWGIKAAPTEWRRAALSCFVTASTNGYGLCVCFSVHRSLPSWCISLLAIGIDSTAPAVKHVW